MTKFNLDFNDTFENEKIKDGEYEVIITQAAEDAYDSGAEYAGLRLTIRNDIPQDHKNSIIFERIFKAKATGQYNKKMFSTIGKAVQLKEGASYSSYEELLNDFLNKPLCVRVATKKSDCGQYENTNVVFGGWKPTAFPNVQHQFKSKGNANTSGNSPFKNDGEPIDISDDDVPF